MRITKDDVYLLDNSITMRLNYKYVNIFQYIRRLFLRDNFLREMYRRWMPRDDIGDKLYWIWC